MQIEVLISPHEFEVLPRRNLSKTTCVVFDILRATTTIVTALANGANSVLPVADIPEALAVRTHRPDVLLAGEREGVRISRALTGSVDFDLGNSPREVSSDRVQDRKIVSTTTNGTRALRACQGSERVLASSFRNLQATADFLNRWSLDSLLVVCSGTGDSPAYEDVLAAGALCELLRPWAHGFRIPDSVQMAQLLFRQASARLTEALTESQNGRRLAELPDLSPDIAVCAQQDDLGIVVHMDREGWLTRL